MSRSRFITRRGARLVAVASATGVLLAPAGAFADAGAAQAAKPTEPITGAGPAQPAPSEPAVGRPAQRPVEGPDYVTPW